MTDFSLPPFNFESDDESSKLDFSTIPTFEEAPTITPDDDRVTLGSYYEQKYWQTGMLPTYEVAAAALSWPVGRVKRVFENKKFQERLQEKGLKYPDEYARGVLLPTQVRLVNELMNISDKKGIREKLQECGVKWQTYQAWKRDPNFVAYMKLRAERLFETAEPTVKAKLVQMAEDGDFQSMRMFLEMTGSYRPGLDINVNVQHIMVKLVEIVSRHVADPVVLEAIAADIEQLELGA